MGTVAGFPFIEAQFGKDGQPVEAAVARGVVEFAQREQLTDLLVLSHGWNNDMADARDLYSRLLAQVRAVLDAGVVPAIAGRTLGVVGVFWPSKKFTDAELIPGGAASLGDGLSEDDTIRDRLDGLKGMFDKPDAAALEAAKQLVGAIEDDPAARRKFVDLVRSVLPEPTDERDDASGTFFHLDGDDIFRLLEAPGLGAPPASSSGGAAGLQDAGGAAGLFDVLSGMKAAAQRLLNFVTYYQMKERAGRVGATGVNPLLREVRRQLPHLKVHLAGHSFGGRLVTATADGSPSDPALGVSSMTLLQAAFSHNGFAPQQDDTPEGFFRQVVVQQKVAGPIVITHTANDTAVGIAYPLASRLARQQASGLGDEHDVYGGIGRNGAVHTPEAVRNGILLPLPGGSNPQRYALESGKIYNLRADAVIGNHSDICKREVAYALLSAVAAT